MKINTYAVLSDCVESGIALGWNRAHKHNDKPTEEIISQTIYESVMAQVAEYFSFDYSEAE